VDGHTIVGATSLHYHSREGMGVICYMTTTSQREIQCVSGDHAVIVVVNNMQGEIETLYVWDITLDRMLPNVQLQPLYPFVKHIKFLNCNHSGNKTHILFTSDTMECSVAWIISIYYGRRNLIILNVSHNILTNQIICHHARSHQGSVYLMAIIAELYFIAGTLQTLAK
jgi:hypothetical protein